MADFLTDTFEAPGPLVNAGQDACVRAATKGIMIHEEISQTDYGKWTHYRTLYLDGSGAYLHHVEVSASLDKVISKCYEYNNIGDEEALQNYLNTN